MKKILILSFLYDYAFNYIYTYIWRNHFLLLLKKAKNNCTLILTTLLPINI